MVYQVLSALGGVSSVALLIAWLWQRAATARAQRDGVEQARLAEELRAALALAQESQDQGDQRYEALVAYWQAKVKELEEALNACSTDPVAVGARLRALLSAPPAADRGGAAGRTVPP